jgi:hypothetical protein
MRAPVAALLTSLLAPVPAWAHEAAHSYLAGADAVEGTAAASTATAGIVVVGAVAVLTLGVALGRRRLALGLVFMLSVFAFETGLHSTHHLGAPARAPECAVAAATAHLAGGSVERVSVDPVIVPWLPVQAERRVQAPRRPPASHEGRAPPATIV